MTTPLLARRWFALLLLLLLAGLARAQTPLPSWNEGPSRQAILEFVQAVTAEGSPDYVAPATASRCSTTTARCGANSPCTSS